MIDVSSIKPAALLAALYNASRPLGMGFLSFTPQDMGEAEAEEILKDATTRQGGGGIAYFDYLKGRVMKVRIGTPTLDPRLYDRDNGEGAAAEVVAGLRAKAAA
jgi:hypothetical protein